MALRPIRRPSMSSSTSFGGSSSRRFLPIVGWLALIAVAAVVPYTIAQATSGGSKHIAEPAPVVATSSVPPVAATTPTPSTVAPTASPSAAVARTTSAPTSTATAPAPQSPATPPAAAPAATTAPTQTTPVTPKPAATYVVMPGDSLWDITRRSAGPSATVESIAAAVQRTYAANRDVIGPDPNILHPGEVLELQP